LLTSNTKYTIEPRLCFRWTINDNHALSLSSGLHGKMEHLELYSFEGQFTDGFSVSKILI